MDNNSAVLCLCVGQRSRIHSVQNGARSVEAMDSIQFEISGGHRVAGEHLQRGSADGAFADYGPKRAASRRVDAPPGHLRGSSESGSAIGRSQSGPRPVL